MWRVLPKKKRIKREGMPRFLYLLSFLAFASWAGWGYLFFFASPDKPSNRILFLLTLFLALFFTFTFLFYEASQIFNAGAPPSPRLQGAGRRAFFIAAFIAFTGAMKLLGIANPANLALFGIILLLTEIQITRR